MNSSIPVSPAHGPCILLMLFGPYACFCSSFCSCETCCLSFLSLLVHVMVPIVVYFIVTVPVLVIASQCPFRSLVPSLSPVQCCVIHLTPVSYVILGSRPCSVSCPVLNSVLVPVQYFIQALVQSSASLHSPVFNPLFSVLHTFMFRPVSRPLSAPSPTITSCHVCISQSTPSSNQCNGTHLVFTLVLDFSPGSLQLFFVSIPVFLSSVSVCLACFCYAFKIPVLPVSPPPLLNSGQRWECYERTLLSLLLLMESHHALKHLR